MCSVEVAGQEVTAVMLRGAGSKGEQGEAREAGLLLRFSWCMKAAIVSSVRGRLAGTQLVRVREDRLWLISETKPHSYQTHNSFIDPSPLLGPRDRHTRNASCTCVYGRCKAYSSGSSSLFLFVFCLACRSTPAYSHVSMAFPSSLDTWSQRRLRTSSSTLC